jgi:hypothetical protein
MNNNYHGGVDFIILNAAVSKHLSTNQNGQFPTQVKLVQRSSG